MGKAQEKSEEDHLCFGPYLDEETNGASRFDVLQEWTGMDEFMFLRFCVC